ncbi:sn-glycerol-3-phosphate ABC transporter ATP-binding protein UgpC [Chitiniphilus purpureus]|uniref:Sn-glycerol-3-phosphate ABC transporter ATP-binding protein UgpC n=1 Tax=Chitiniphilus purpureus TaxID=2981137 RepID=A0ABY6DNY0_9NEIS|nr:sn-glycerol-3-phosphate ABC transporter ATP-binding protein UgpC [Chitiniphilus sp. CD1]UXY15191.1 sn-glycerol-3-phosphate ABC transporter ATP-binding protein UgpC [Chitiniphilus sp. CD1]
MAAVHLSGIKKAYTRDQYIIPELDLDIADGEFMVFVGPSGCGKSTLLRMIAGLEPITAGQLRIGELVANNVHASKRGIAMVFQSYALYPHMTVAENMGFALKLAGTPKAEIAAKVERAAQILQITHLLERKPKALSGGQRQRVAIGRAIVREPKVFLFDEPLSNLDAALRLQMRVELAKLHHELGTTMIYVTHDQVEAMTLGDRIAVFNAGRIEQIGSPLTLYHEPRNLFVAGFLGSPKMNLLPCTLLGDSEHGAIVGLAGAAIATRRCSPAQAPGTTLTLGVRPEQIMLVPADQPGAIAARVDLVEHLGDVMLGYVEIEGLRDFVTVKLPSGITLGGMVHLAFAPEACHLFDESGHALARVDR